MHLKHLWENYTPEQEREQASWKTSLFKVKFPGKEPKKPSVPKASTKTTAPDPFDTKPLPKQS